MTTCQQTDPMEVQEWPQENDIVLFEYHQLHDSLSKWHFQCLQSSPEMKISNWEMMRREVAKFRKTSNSSGSWVPSVMIPKIPDGEGIISTACSAWMRGREALAGSEWDLTLIFVSLETEMPRECDLGDGDRINGILAVFAARGSRFCDVVRDLSKIEEVDATGVGCNTGLGIWVRLIWPDDRNPEDDLMVGSLRFFVCFFSGVLMPWRVEISLEDAEKTIVWGDLAGTRGGSELQ